MKRGEGGGGRNKELFWVAKPRMAKEIVRSASSQKEGTYVSNPIEKGGGEFS